MADTGTPSNSSILALISAMFPSAPVDNSDQANSFRFIEQQNGNLPAQTSSGLVLNGTGDSAFFSNSAGVPLGKDLKPLLDASDPSKLLNPSDVLNQLKTFFGGG